MDKIDSFLIEAAVLLERQYLLTKHLIDSRGEALKEFEQAIAQQQQTINNVLDVYNYVFALIDHLIRYQKIAFSIPRLNKKIVEYRALDEAMGELKKIRNQFQHINNDIENKYIGPLLGSICWISNQKQFMALFHDLSRQRSAPGIILNTRTDQYSHNFCYVYNEKYYDIEKAILGMHTFNEYIRSLVEIKVDGKNYNAKEHFTALCIDLKSKKVFQ